MFIPRISLNNVGDPPGPHLGVIYEIRAKETNVVLRRSTMIATKLVGVRRAEFPLHFPHQIGEFASRGHTIHQRQITVVHDLPIDLRHVHSPEIIALEPPRLAIHLAPLGGWLDGNPYPTQVDPSTLPAGRFLGSTLLGFFTSLQDPQPSARAI